MVAKLQVRQCGSAWSAAFSPNLKNTNGTNNTILRHQGLGSVPEGQLIRTFISHCELRCQRKFSGQKEAPGFHFRAGGGGIAPTKTGGGGLGKGLNWQTPLSLLKKRLRSHFWQGLCMSDFVPLLGTPLAHVVLMIGHGGGLHKCVARINQGPCVLKHKYHHHWNHRRPRV